jgi:hypothetical protein
LFTPKEFCGYRLNWRSSPARATKCYHSLEVEIDLQEHAFMHDKRSIQTQNRKKRDAEEDPEAGQIHPAGFNSRRIRYIMMNSESGLT